MNNSFDQFLDKLFLSLGIRPVFGVTFLMLLFSLSETKKIKKWKDIPYLQKQFAVLTWIATLLCIIGSIVSLF